MMCYLDRTFCSATNCLHFKECPSALTDEVKREAQKAGLPISQFLNPTTNYCYKPYERSTNSHHPAGN